MCSDNVAISKVEPQDFRAGSGNIFGEKDKSFSGASILQRLLYHADSRFFRTSIKASSVSLATRSQL